ncbi:MAG: hypothetical protein DMF08_08860 [Verrucomicrobia bacterium]|nr:MAG: hypothetical protein DMF08_08860 [Verrucomicrobiota bacterium]
MLLEAALRTEHSVRNSQCSAEGRPPMPSWLTGGELQDILSCVNRFGESASFRIGGGEGSENDRFR